MSSDNKSYLAVTARKAAKLSRPNLDCGHTGDAFQHIWCDRLACKACADLDHDCAAFGGAKSSAEEGEEEDMPGFDAFLDEVAAAIIESRAAASRPFRCRGCRLWIVQDVKLCGPCSVLPSCLAERSAVEWGGTVKCFRPDGHDGQHESVQGRCWMDAPPGALDDAAVRSHGEALRLMALPEPWFPIPDAGPWGSFEVGDVVQVDGFGGFRVISVTPEGASIRLQTEPEISECPDDSVIPSRRPFLMATIDAQREEIVDRVAEAMTARVTVATPEEAAANTRTMETRSLECSRRTPMCSGCDGAAAWGSGPCLHECHEEPEVPADAPDGPWEVEVLGGGDWIANMVGIEWSDAPLPPKRHVCLPQTRARLDGERVERCSCGAIRRDEPGFPWIERNQRKAPARRPWWKRWLP